jgi:hypothetical protein
MVFSIFMNVVYYGSSDYASAKNIGMLFITKNAVWICINRSSENPEWDESCWLDFDRKSWEIVNC